MSQLKFNKKTDQRPFGVNMGGHIASEGGLGEAVRANIRSLSATSIPYVLNHFVDTQGVKNIDRTYTQFSEENSYSINLVHVNTFERLQFIEGLREAYLRGHYNIGFWAWEFSDFPSEWLSSFQYFNEIWVPSSYNQDIISRVAPISVIKIPHSLAEDRQLPDLSRSSFGLPEDYFIFLFVFSFHGHFNRKNPLGLIGAFQKAFGRKDKACLVLKCPHSEYHPEEFKKMRAAAKDSDSKIIIIDSVSNRNEINTLMSLCDCYVSLHRSEGFGLTMAEAMHLKKPVIATGYSGNMDFMNENNSFLVKYKLIDISEADVVKRGWPPLIFQKGYSWAEPDVGQAAELMRYVYENRQDAAKIGEQASEDVKRFLSPKTIGLEIAERLKKIWKVF